MIRKFSLIVVIGIILDLSLTAQTEFIYFNEVYNPDTLFNNMLSTNALEVEGGYLIAGIYDNSIQRHLYLRKIDSKGATLWFKHIDSGWELNALSSGKLMIKSIYQDEIIIAYFKTNEPSGSISNLHVVRFDAQCDEVIWETVIDDGFSRIPHKIMETNNAEFIVVGSHAEITPGIFAQINIGKYDFEGDQMWEKQYGYNARGVGVIQDNDDFIYVGGFVFNEETNFDGYLIKLTEEGDSLWTKTFGGNGVDCGGFLSLMPNGNILFNGCEQVDWAAHMYLAEITPDGDIVWDKVFTELNDLNVFQTNIEIVETPFTTIARGIRANKSQYVNWSNIWMEVNLTTKQIIKEIDIPQIRVASSRIWNVLPMGAISSADFSMIVHN